jgi:hypothetical protein
VDVGGNGGDGSRAGAVTGPHHARPLAPRGAALGIEREAEGELCATWCRLLAKSFCLE